MTERRYIYTADIKRVIDGDTLDCLLTVNTDIGFHINAAASTLQRVRIAGVDTPEMRPRQNSRWSKTHTREQEKDAARQAAHYVQQWVERWTQSGRWVTVETHKTDSFGRYIGDFVGWYRDGRMGGNLAADLISRKLGRPYDG